MIKKSTFFEKYCNCSSNTESIKENLYIYVKQKRGRKKHTHTQTNQIYSKLVQMMYALNEIKWMDAWISSLFNNIMATANKRKKKGKFQSMQQKRKKTF